MYYGDAYGVDNSHVELVDPYYDSSIPFSADGKYYPIYNGQGVNCMGYPNIDTNLTGATFGHSQVPTPSSSNSSSPIIVDPSHNNTDVLVSTAFFPGAHSMENDLCFSSSDKVLFYVHSKVILADSEKAFSSLLSKKLNEKYCNTIINIPEESVVLNVILHALYNLSCAQNSPSLPTLLTAVNKMPFYHISVRKHVAPTTPLYQLLLSQAPLYPIEIYSLAAQHSLEDLAVNTSSHLLSYPLSSITDETAQRMGAIYLKRLMCLHLGRTTALKNILLIPPPPHAPTKECNFTDQKKLTRAWALVSAYLAWEGRPDLSTSSMKSALTPLTEQLTCNQCHKTLQKRIQDVVVQWASVKRTI